MSISVILSKIVETLHLIVLKKHVEKPRKRLKWFAFRGTLCAHVAVTNDTRAYGPIVYHIVFFVEILSHVACSGTMNIMKQQKC